MKVDDIGHASIGSARAAFQPIDDEAWPSTLAAIRDGHFARMNVYRVMAHNPALMIAW